MEGGRVSGRQSVTVGSHESTTAAESALPRNQVKPPPTTSNRARIVEGLGRVVRVRDTAIGLDGR